MHPHRVEVDISDGEEYILEIVIRRRRAHPPLPQTAPQALASSVAEPTSQESTSTVRPDRRAPLNQPQTTRPPPASPAPAVIPDRRATPIRPQTAPQPPVSSTTEPTTSVSTSVVTSEYDGDLLRQVCPGHLIGQPCLQGHNCDKSISKITAAKGKPVDIFMEFLLLARKCSAEPVASGVTVRMITKTIVELML
ncbi:hypothetical protein BDV39DRAFT_204435 [Aspergillus sergii]|uniref:Uncharacterized protein n=1 Tax=Aspergillus sergii TaxID=1034303 RepID=A0A5N6X5D3_9EURO|nr:hypothetical protein BDV39DRAFT_204435 [Aspergillus sergii]